MKKLFLISIFCFLFINVKSQYYQFENVEIKDTSLFIKFSEKRGLCILVINKFPEYNDSGKIIINCGDTTIDIIQTYYITDVYDKIVYIGNNIKKTSSVMLHSGFYTFYYEKKRKHEYGHAKILIK